MAPSPPRTAGWDPWLLISQIVSMQSFHYLVLCMLVPPLLMVFAEPHALEHEGGALQVAVIMDWREMSSLPTTRGPQNYSDLDTFKAMYNGEDKVGIGFRLGDEPEAGWNLRIDPTRGWCIAVAWFLASTADIYYLYTFVRRPRLILDFSLTLVLNHLILTTYYSSAFPSSFFFWIVIITSACLTIISTEQLCVRREMREGLTVGAWNVDPNDGNARVGEADAMELGRLRRD